MKVKKMKTEWGRDKDNVKATLGKDGRKVIKGGCACLQLDLIPNCSSSALVGINDYMTWQRGIPRQWKMPCQLKGTFPKNPFKASI